MKGMRLPCEDKAVDDHVFEWRLAKEGSGEYEQRVEP